LDAAGIVSNEIPRRCALSGCHRGDRACTGVKPKGIHIVTNVAFGGDDGKTLFVTGLTDPMDGKNQRQCGDAACLSAGIYTARLNVQGFPF
jgi:hypothetical protein